MNTISSGEALRIASEDATKVYADLSSFSISVCYEDDGWHVDYRLRDRKLKGGGPHYVIDAASGEIAFKRYER